LRPAEAGNVSVALLRTRRERQSSRVAKPGDEFAPSKPNAHRALSCDSLSAAFCLADSY
jgi:hypothetical protein